MKIVSTAAALAATFHLCVLPLASTTFSQQADATLRDLAWQRLDPDFKPNGWQRYISDLYAKQTERLSHMPLSYILYMSLCGGSRGLLIDTPYSHGIGATACHAFTCPSHSRRNKCADGECLQDDGTPMPDSINAARKTTDWNDGWLERLHAARERLQQRRIERRLERA